MNKKLLKGLKFITIVCVIILIIELIYFIYVGFYRKDKSILFDGYNSIALTDDGFVTVGSNNDNEKYYEKAKIIKYNERREKIFEKLYNKGLNGSFFGVAVDSDITVAVGGYEATNKEHKNNNRSALMVAYDKDGEILFENVFNELSYSKFMNVKVVDDGYIVCGQSIYSSNKVGNSSLGGAYLIKYDKSGNLVWKVNYGNNKSAIFNDIYIDDNYIYAVGLNNDRVGIIVRYDLDGNYIDSNDYKYTDRLGFSGVTKMDNYIYVASANRRTASDTDAMIIRYTTNLKYVDEVIYTGEELERFNKIITDKNDNLVAIGSMATTTEDKKNKINEYKYNGLIAKYDKELKKIAVVTYGNDYDDYFNDVVEYDGSYIVVGYSSYENDEYFSKYIKYSDALKVLEIE